MHYIPAIHCAKCGKDLPYGFPHVMRMQADIQPVGTRRFISVRCHGEQEEIDFAEKSGERIVLWQSQSVQGS
jgi:hypothetical protein